MPFPPPEALPDPGTEPSSLLSPALAGGFLTTSTTWEAPLEPSFSPKAAHRSLGKHSWPSAHLSLGLLGTSHRGGPLVSKRGADESLHPLRCTAHRSHVTPTHHHTDAYSWSTSSIITQSMLPLGSSEFLPPPSFCFPFCLSAPSLPFCKREFLLNTGTPPQTHSFL